VKRFLKALLTDLPPGFEIFAALVVVCLAVALGIRCGVLP
jgi:hypothetical protein